MHLVLLSYGMSQQHRPRYDDVADVAHSAQGTGPCRVAIGTCARLALYGYRVYAWLRHRKPGLCHSPRQGLCQREGVGPSMTMPARMTGCRQCATPSAHGRAPGEAPGCPALAVSQARLGHQPPREAGAGQGGARRASRPLEGSGIAFAHSLGQQRIMSIRQGGKRAATARRCSSRLHNAIAEDGRLR
jgi:hypothetical protein